MSDMPERIWAWEQPGGLGSVRGWTDRQVRATEYIRKDITAPRWFRIDDPDKPPPKGEWVERQTGKGIARVHVPKRIIALMSDGDWTVSYWIEKSQRWNMFTQESPPLAWFIPEPPK